MNVGIYIRLSSADADAGIFKSESDSIVCQRMYLNDYLDKQSDLNSANRLEFCDDGFTATNGNRPQFQKMIEQVQAGGINTILVRDFSRFFRDYIEAGNYLECVFPFLGVRFISINDNYDSNDYIGTTGGLEMVMRNIVYASYSKDLSAKVRASKEMLLKKGEFQGSKPPFGYKRSKLTKNHLVIDKDAAEIVKLIFEMAIAGNNTSKIAEHLNELQIPTMGNYYYRNKAKNPVLSGACWNVSMINRILNNPAYTGTLIGRKTKYKGIGGRIEDGQSPIICENAFEAIVTKEQFAKAGEVIERRIQVKKRTAIQYPLRNIIKCGNCKRGLERRCYKNDDVWFICSNSTNHKTSDCKRGRLIEEAAIETLVYSLISQYVDVLQDSLQISAGRKNSAVDFVAELSSLDSKIESLRKFKIRLYENYTSGELTKELFLQQKADADTRIADIEANKSELEEKMRLPAIEENSDNKTENLMSVFLKNDRLTREMAQAFIKAIYVHGENDVEIEWRFKDIFTEATNA